MRQVQFELRGEFITLDHLLKATGLAGSGGAAKALVAAGSVQVDGRDELRKTCKIRAGQVEPLATSGASILSSTTRADGFVLVPRDSEGHGPGEVVQVFLYD